ncbi:hypothetical protein H4R35_005676 [Dimargaris xerosporica]|nr:hypothetical protein H4R35_005676 [Dimargaris xerosporica]
MKLVTAFGIAAILASSTQSGASALPKVTTVAPAQDPIQLSLSHLTRRHSTDPNNLPNGHEEVSAEAAVEAIRQIVTDAVSHRNWADAGMIISEQYKRYSHGHQHLGSNPLPGASETFLDRYISNPSNPNYDGLIQRYDLGYLNVPRPGDSKYVLQVPPHGVELMNLGIAIPYCIKAAQRNQDVGAAEFLDPIFDMIEAAYASEVMSV